MKNKTLILAGLLSSLSFSVADAAATVELKGKTYTLREHPRVWVDGPGGARTQQIQTTFATPSNPIWAAIVTNSKAFTANNYYKTPNVDFKADTYVNTPGARFAGAALHWFGDRTQTASRDAAIWGINHIEDIVGGTYACDETKQYCGGRAIVQDFSSDDMTIAALMYSLMRSELTPAERQLFANKVLSDLDTNCQRPAMVQGIGTITGQGTTQIVGSGTQFLSQLSPGDSILLPTQNSRRVISVQDNTHLTAHEQYNNAEIIGSGFSIGRPWSAGQCGWTWFVKHHNQSPFSGPTLYPPQGGGPYVDGRHNLTLVKLRGFIALGLALADDDPRARAMLTQSFDYYYDQSLPIMKNMWTGFTQSGSSYSPGRTTQIAIHIAQIMQASVINGPDLVKGTYLKDIMPVSVFTYLPYATNLEPKYSPWGEDWDGEFAAGTMIQAVMAASLYPDSTEGQTMSYWLRNVWHRWSTISGFMGSYLPYFYPYLDPQAPQKPLSSVPTQRLFRRTDFAQCAGMGLACLPNKQYANVVSRTGWASTTDTLAHVIAMDYEYFDHSGIGQPGAYRIYKNARLIAGDSNGGVSQRGGESIIMLGPTEDLADPLQDTQIPRWAGADPSGDADSRYTYALIDMKAAYRPSAGAIRVDRHFAHLKKSGTDDVIAFYDDIAAGNKGMRAVTHYNQNGQSGEGNTTIDSAAKSVFSASLSSRLHTQVFSPDGPGSIRLYTEGSNGQYPNGLGYTSRVSVCPSVDGGTSCAETATQAEWVMIHQPLIGSTGSGAPVTMLSATGFVGAQVGGSSPKVFLFSRQGQLRSATAIATNHSGNAQYLIAGLNAGLYRVTRNGADILTGLPVQNNDNSLYFEAASGTMQITRDGDLPIGLNQPPVADNMIVSVSPDTAQDILLSATDPEGAALTYTVVSNPSKGTLSGSGASRRYQPNTGATGTDSFTFRVNDGSLDSNLATVSLSIGNAPPPPPPPPTGATLFVSPSGNDSAACSAAAPCREIRKALTLVNPGMTILVADGQYKGFDIAGISGTPGAPITIKAQGKGATVNPTTDRGDNRDNIYIVTSDFVVIDGLKSVNAPRAGIRIDQSHNVTVRNAVFASNQQWGIFTNHSNDLRIENNETYGTRVEHGIYVSNSADRPVIRGNRSHDNAGAGLHMNGDISSGGGREVLGDGIISGALIENNIFYGNGALGGGAAINMDGVQDSVIRNNLLYAARGKGIIAYRGDSAMGPKGLQILHNTIHQTAASNGYCLQLAYTAGLNTVRNNICFNESKGWIAYGSKDDPNFASQRLLDIRNTDSDYNLLAGNTCLSPDDWGTCIALPQWQTHPETIRQGGREIHSRTASGSALFKNPVSADYHLANNSPAIDAGGAVANIENDLEGRSRPLGLGYDAGAYESTASGSTPPLLGDPSKPFLAAIDGKTFPLNSEIRFAYADPVTGFNWEIQEAPNPAGGAGASGGNERSLQLILPAPFATLSPAFPVREKSLPAGRYVIRVQAVNITASGIRTSEWATATITLVNADMSSVKVYPNPWRSDRHGSQGITFSGLPLGSTIKIFGTSGHLVREFMATGAQTTWDRLNATGDTVASGIYIYLIKDASGAERKGKLAIVK